MSEINEVELPGVRVRCGSRIAEGIEPRVEQAVTMLRVG